MKKTIVLGTLICTLMQANNIYGMLPTAKRIIKSPKNHTAIRRYCSDQKFQNNRHWTKATEKLYTDLEFLQDNNKQRIANLAKQSLVFREIQKNIETNNRHYHEYYLKPHMQQITLLAKEQQKIEAEAAAFFSKIHMLHYE